MRRLSISLAVVALALLALGVDAAAQSSPEYRLGFKALADQVPDVVGQPLENEQYAPNGDSLQRTSNGLMAWRKADNWTAFTDGYQSWVNGPNGVQSRLNDQRFPWEAPALTPTPTRPLPTPFAPIPSPTPSPTATPAPTPTLKLDRVDIMAGELLESNTLWVLGELRNEGTIPAYSIKITALFLSDTGGTVASGIQSYNYLAPGETIGFRVQVQKPMAYAKTDISVTGVGTSFAQYEKLQVAGTPMQKTTVSDAGGDAFEWTSSVTNTTSKTLTACIAYVWFLDEYGRIIWADVTFPSTSLAPGASADFAVRTLRYKYHPPTAGINQVRAYAVGIAQ